MLDCKYGTAPELPKGQEVLIKYADNSSGDNSSPDPSPSRNYISFSTDGGLTWSSWKLYAGSSTGGGSGGSSGLLFNRFGNHELVGSPGSWGVFQDGVYKLEYAAPVDTLTAFGESFEIEALFRFKNTASNKPQKVGFMIGSGSNFTVEYETLTDGSGVAFEYKLKVLVTFYSLPTGAYYTSEFISLGSPTNSETSTLNVDNIMSASSIITITPVGDVVNGSSTNATPNDEITCLYLSVYKK